MDVENLMFLQMKVEDLAVQMDVENLVFLQMKVEDLAPPSLCHVWPLPRHSLS